MININDILVYFPFKLYNILLKLFNENSKLVEELREIRIKIDKPIIFRLRERDIIVDYIVTSDEMLQIIEKLCENSIYAYKNQICNGFITVKGGHRVGITGSCVIENNKIINVKYISSINFRIAREILNCSKNVLKDIIDIENKTIFNSVIVAPPGKGKTTILRDIIRNLSNGIPEINFKGKICGVVDERGEIAAMYKGIPQNDIGIRTDVIENVSKPQGIQMLIRSMGPEIIACDEIGNFEDVQAIRYAIHSGVKGIFTMHGNCIEDIKMNKDINELVENSEIQKVIFI